MELIINVAIKEQMDKHTPESEIYDVLSCALETIKDREDKIAKRDAILDLLGNAVSSLSSMLEKHMDIVDPKSFYTKKNKNTA